MAVSPISEELPALDSFKPAPEMANWAQFFLNGFP